LGPERVRGLRRAFFHIKRDATAKSIERDLVDLAAIRQDLRSMMHTLEIIADNTSDEVPDHGF